VCPEIKGRQRDVEFRLVTGLGSRLFEAPDRRLDLLGPARRLRPHIQRLSVLRVLGEDRRHLVSRPGWLARHEVDRAELETNVEIRGVILPRFQQVRERASRLTEVIMREGEPVDGVSIQTVDPRY
jgi:hypothetical protein